MTRKSSLVSFFLLYIGPKLCNYECDTICNYDRTKELKIRRFTNNHNGTKRILNINKHYDYEYDIIWILICFGYHKYKQA